MTLNRVVLVAGAIAFGSVASAAADSLTIAAHAGLGGVSRAGRWTPVRVTIDNLGADVSGVLVVSWGDFEVRRDVALPSPSRKQFELYVRTADVESTVRVRLVSAGVDRLAVDAPIRLVGAQETATLCVYAGGALDASDDSCDARTTAGMLPDSARGYDAFDRVIWPGGQILTDRQQTAVDRWRMLRRLEDSGDLDAAPRVSRPIVPRGLPEATHQVVAVVVAAYVCALIAAGALFGTHRATTRGLGVALAILMCVGSAAALAVGRSGTASAIVIQHATVLRQLPGERGSAVLMRGVVEFPTFDAFTLRAAIADGFLEPASAPEKAAHTFDEQGHPTLAGTFGLGSRQSFALEGFTPLRPVGLTADGSLVRVANRTSHELRDCRFVEGFSGSDVGTLRPGETAEARQSTDLAGPVFSCTLSEAPIDFVETSRAVQTRGTTRVVVYR